MNESRSQNPEFRRKEKQKTGFRLIHSGFWLLTPEFCVLKQFVCVCSIESQALRLASGFLHQRCATRQEGSGRRRQRAWPASLYASVARVAQQILIQLRRAPI